MYLFCDWNLHPKSNIVSWVLGYLALAAFLNYRHVYTISRGHFFGNLHTLAVRNKNRVKKRALQREGKKRMKKWEKGGKTCSFWVPDVFTVVYSRTMWSQLTRQYSSKNISFSIKLLFTEIINCNKRPMIKADMPSVILHIKMLM